MRAKLVIYRLGSLGDTVIALPMFHAIARAFPEHERIVLTNFPVANVAAPLMGVLEGSGLVHAAVSYPVGLRSFGGLLAVRQKVRSLGAQTMVYLAAPRGLAACYRDLLFFKACGFRRIIGAPITGDLQRNRIDAQGLEEPEYERMGRCLASLGPIDFNDRAVWDLKLTEAELAAGKRAIAPLSEEPFIAINMGGKASEKDWGVPRWLALLKSLAEHTRTGLLIVGATDDLPRAEEVAKAWPGRAVAACGTLSPRGSGAAMRRARLFVGHDSGPLHMASAVGVPCIGLFGNYNRPRKWHPLGARHRNIHDMRGVDAIEVETVLDAARAILSEAPTTGPA